MIKSFAALVKTQHAYETSHHIASQSGLLKDMYNDKSIEGLNRYENVQELLSGIKEFSERQDIEDKSLTQYLQDIALLTGDDKVEEKEGDSDTVSLMTIHAAKGLEFPHVRSEEQTTELKPLMRTTYAVFECKQKTTR